MSDQLLPCEGCGFMMEPRDGRANCGDCREYGPPRDWRWQYDETSGRHVRVSLGGADDADRLMPVLGGRLIGTGADHKNAGAGSLDIAASPGKRRPLDLLAGIEIPLNAGREAEDSQPRGAV